MALPLIAAGIGGLSSLVSAFANKNHQIKSERLGKTSGIISGATDVANNIGNLAMTLTANRRNKKNWEQMNQYNHPSSQMARYRQAGLNPNMVYRSGASGVSGNAEAMPNTEVGGLNFDSSPISKYVNIKSTEARTRNETAKYDNILEDTALKGLQGAESTMKTAKGWQEKQQASKLFQGQMDMQAENLRQRRLTNFEQSLINSNLPEKLKQDLAYTTNQALLIKENTTNAQHRNLFQKYVNQLASYGLSMSDPVLMKAAAMIFPKEFKQYLESKGDYIYDRATSEKPPRKGRTTNKRNTTSHQQPNRFKQTRHTSGRTK